MREKIKLNLFWLLPLFIASLLFLPALGSRPLEDADEATYAIVTSEMITSHDWLTFTHLGNLWFEKPPLPFWLSGLASLIFSPLETALRLPMALFGLLSIISVSLISFLLTQSKTSGLLAGLTLTLLPNFIAAARNFRPDVPLTFFILLALLFFLLKDKDERWLLGVGSSFALAFLCKSFVAFLIIPIIFFFSLPDLKFSYLKNRWLWLGNLLGLLILLPWHLYELKLFGSNFWQEYFGFHVFTRFTESILGNDISTSYILYVFWRFVEPWTLIFIFSLFATFWLWYKYRPFSLKTYSTLFSPLASIIIIFSIFLISRTTLITYFIPALPFLALFLASVYNSLNNHLQSKTFLNYITIIIFLTAFYPAINESFLNPHFYVSSPVQDAKPIGQLLKKNNQPWPIFLYEYPSDQTIIYYSNLSVEHLSTDNNDRLEPPFYLIIPSPLLSSNTWLQNFPHLYQGNYLSLISVNP